MTCQTKIEEAKKRVMAGMNASNETLSGARASDLGNHMKDGAVDTATTVKDRVVATGSLIGDSVSNGFDRVKEGFSSAADKTKEGFNAASDSTASTFGKMRDGVADAADRATGKTYRLRVPGHDHSMTFHCFGGLESNECLEEKEIVVAAIKGGSDAESLEEFKLSPLYRAKDFVVDTAVAGKDKTVEFIGRLDHLSCRNKIARHARDFDEDYGRTGSQLVSYQEKLEYIEEEMIEEGRMEECQSHFDNATLGYQLKWVSGGEVVREKTHIFDGLGRLADGDIGYWKNEERSEYQGSSSSRR